MIQVLIFFVIGAFLFLILAYMYPNLLGKGGKEISNFLASSGDYDGDGIANYFDKCACKSGNKDNDGCPKGFDIEKLEEERERCKTEMDALT